MRDCNKKMFIIMSLSALLISGSYKVYADTDTQIYKCIAQNGNIAYQDYVCNKASITEQLVFVAKKPQAQPSSLRQHEIKAIEHMHQRLHQQRALSNQLQATRVRYQQALVPQQQVLELHLHHSNNYPNISQNVNQNTLVIKK